MNKLLRVIGSIIKAILIVIGILAVILVLVAVALALAGTTRHTLAQKSVLVFDLNTKITDRSKDERSEMLAHLFNQNDFSLQLRTATTALRAAARDPRILGLYLHGSLRTDGYSSGYAALKELREAIQDFQKSGKPVIAYITDADNRNYYVESAADQILLNPFGVLAFRGLAAQGVFIKGAADKYGFEFTPTRHGKYKSAIEPLTRENYSPENREQLEALLKTIWDDMRDTVAHARKISPDDLQTIVDQQGLITADMAKDKGLVTDLAYEGDALDKLRQLTGKPGKDRAFPQISIAQYAREVRRSAFRHEFGKDKIAVVYAEGEIIDGEGQRGSQDEVAGDRFARMIRGIRDHDNIKAIVLRVNSPGGSAQASEVILDELRRFNAERPVIVSMGTVAASGGYFISMASRRIIAEPSTITGSIGVFGLTMDAQKIANDHGITFDTVKTGTLADMFTISRPMTPQEHDILQHLVDEIYDKFVARVASCRKLTTNQVDDIAQGRVWSGKDALGVGLVDEMGGLQKAIDVAAHEANLGTNYAVVEYPVQKPFIEELAEDLRGDQQPLVKNDFPSRVLQKMMLEWRWLSGFNDPNGVYARLPYEMDLN
jgi:protease-4